MSKSIPNGLTKQHILSALADLDSGIEHSFGPATGYELVHDGKRYPPKAVIGLAFKHMPGSTLSHKEFSGGEALGQANYVLRNLGFDVVTKSNSGRKCYITSRNFPLPTDLFEMESNFWFNMWQRRLWPYQELQEGSILYWYETREKAIIWESIVKKVDRFEYSSKDEVRKRFENIFGITNFSDTYFDNASNQGYCLAYKVGSITRLRIPKPADLKFPMDGWLRSSNENGSKWLNKVALPVSTDGSATNEVTETTANLDKAGYFSPESLQDERKKKLAEIVQRRGQPDFRKKLIAAYDSRCAITGCDALAALEAAHIIPYTGPQSNYVTNGLLLRADIHTLFDLDLVGIDPESLTISLAPALSKTVYSDLKGMQLRLPANIADQPNLVALAERWE